jgi:hypothetical protein
VGDSGGTRGNGAEERCDVGAAEAALVERMPDGMPLAIVGYSFGAWVGAMAACGLPRVRRVVAVAPPLAFFDWGFAATRHPPLAVVVGDRDQYCPTDALRRLQATGDVPATVIAGADHFFAGRVTEVGDAVVRLLAAD